MLTTVLLVKPVIWNTFVFIFACIVHLLPFLRGRPHNLHCCQLVYSTYNRYKLVDLKTTSYLLLVFIFQGSVYKVLYCLPCNYIIKHFSLFVKRFRKVFLFIFLPFRLSCKVFCFIWLCIYYKSFFFICQ